MKPKARPPGNEPPAPLAAAQARETRDADPDPDSEADDLGSDADADLRIVERPDGYHWVTLDGTREFGPFETVGEARADMRSDTDDTPEPAQTLQEAEHTIGMADWIDPLTGEPAEGQSPPHLDEE